MKLRDVMKKLNLEQKCGPGDIDTDVAHCYTGDILSDVMAHARDGCVWITLQTHGNIITVATLKNMAGIILVNGRQPDDETVKKANDEGVPIFTTENPAYEIAGQLYGMGIKG